mgnify:CR=1 FL=1
MGLIRTELMPDSSEVVPYDHAGIPLYIRAAHLASYYNMCAPCHWHDDIEWIYIITGKMRYYVNGKRLILNEGDSLMVNARQMHYGYAFEQQDCYFLCILFHPSLFGNNQILQEKYFLPFFENTSLEFHHFYSNDEAGVKVGRYLQEVLLLKEDSDSVEDYTWVKIKGDDGKDLCVNGKCPYFRILIKNKRIQMPELRKISSVIVSSENASYQDIEVYFVARGAHLKKIQEQGLKVITETGSFVAHPTLATDNVENIGTVDYLIMCTKSYDLNETVEQMKPCIGSETVILPLLNGADISERIRALLPSTEVWQGCVYIVGRLNEPGVVESSGGLHDLFFGYEQNAGSERLLFMEKLMKEAGIKAHLSKNIRSVIWRKFIFISTTASLTSCFNVGFRDVLADEKLRPITMAFMKEVAAVAAAEGVEFEQDIIETTVRHIERLPFGTTSSMHSDFKAGRNTELDTLTRIVIELGRKHGISTPTYEMIYNQLKG